MEKLSMCRICLRENVKLKCIANTELQEVYQKLTCSTLKTEDCRPLNTCYLCSALLYKAYMLMVDCLAAEQWFTNVFKGINCLKHEVRCLKLSKTSVSSDEVSFVKSKRNNKKHLQTKTTESQPENNYGNLLEISIECNKKINVDLEPSDDDTKKGKVEQIDEDEIVIPKQEQDCDVDIKDPFNEIIQVKIEEFTENIDGENKNLLKNGSIPDFEASENEDKVTNSDTPNSKKKRVNIKQKKRIIKKKRLIPKRPKIFACEQCPKVFKLKGNYERHKYVHNKNVICSCSICGKPFTVPQSYTKHMNWHTKPYKCDLCSAQYPELYQLKQHMALHEFGEVRYTCDYCQKTFKDKSGVRAHIMNNHAERPFACQLCDKSFATERKYDRHVSIIHAETEQYQCDKCAKTFRHYSSLYGHLKSHEDFKPHKCPLCKMGFARQGGLRTHMLRQCGGLTQKCPLCDETFVRLKHLIQHKREAHSVGVFKCETCQMQLANPHSLKKHMRTHTGEKPYKCDVCDRSFSDGYTLKGHVRTHTGEKPYMCPLCPKAFAQKTPLTTHMRTHNSKKYK